MTIHTMLKTTNLSRGKLELSIRSLGLSKDSEAVLAAHGITNVGQLLERSEEEVRAILGLGEGHLEELQANLVRMGLFALSPSKPISGMAREARERIDAVLNGQLDRSIAAAWAREALGAEGVSDSPLLQDAVAAMSNLDHDDERFDTSQEDLEYYRDCLLGKRNYWPAVRFRQA